MRESLYPAARAPKLGARLQRPENAHCPPFSPTPSLRRWALLSTVGIPATGAAGADSGMAWRLMLGLGALPGLALLPFKAAASDPKPPLATSDGDVLDAPNEASSSALVFGESSAEPASPTPERLTLLGALRERKYWGKLLGTAGGWFLFDITFYGNSLFQPTVLGAVFNVDQAHRAAEAPVTGDLTHNLCAQMAVVSAIGLPGYYVSVWLMDTLGRRRIQLQGFLLMALTFSALGLGYEALDQTESGRLAMLFLYGLTFFFSNFGPNSTTFILPSETFPHEVRSTLNGFSAAMGKLGATIGSATFSPMKDAFSAAWGDAAGLRWTMVACAAVSLAGFVLTYFFVEDRRGVAMDGGAASEVSGAEGGLSDGGEEDEETRL